MINLINLSFAYTAHDRDAEEIIAEEREDEKQQNIFERGREAEENKAEESEKQPNIFERGREAEENEAEERKSEEENIAKEREVECRKKENRHKTREENKTAQGRSYTVLGRLSVPGTKRKYTVTQDEIKRRIITENMSNNMLRSLIRVCTSKLYSNLL